MPDSIRTGMKRSFSYLANSIYENDSRGQIFAQFGGSSSSDNKDACIGKNSQKQEKEIKTHDHSVVIDSYSKASHGFSEKILEGQKKPSVSDNYSEAAGCNSHEIGTKRKSDTKKYFDEDETLLESSSVCSLEDSNNTHDYFSDNDEETEYVMKEKPAWEGIRVKRRRNAEIHNSHERKRRDKINKKMRILKELIPNCNKMDKASMLDDAIEYLKTLKLQLQIMSMGAGLCMPQMMLPIATSTRHMMNTPQYLHQLMCFRMRPQFPMTPLFSGVNENNRVIGMFGFPNQQMPFSHSPFILPILGNPSTQPFLVTNTPSNLEEDLASRTHYSHHNGQDVYATKASTKLSFDTPLANPVTKLED